MLFACIGGIFLIFLAVGAFLPYRIGFYNDLKKQDLSHHVPDREPYTAVRDRLLSYLEELDSRPFETVSIRSRDGKRLTARYYHLADGAPLDIGFHGYKSYAVRDFCGGARISFALGHNLLLPDQRSHGKSDGRTISFGILERFDCLDWVAYANERFGADVPICLYGVSMGAATVLMASDLPLPANVRAVIADCPYSSPHAIVERVAKKDLHLPFRLLLPLLRLGTRLYGGFRFDPRISAVNAVKQARVPILILHGEADTFVPCEMSREIQSANPNGVTLRTFPEATHAMSYLVDPEGYEAEVRRFLQGLD